MSVASPATLTRLTHRTIENATGADAERPRDAWRLTDNRVQVRSSIRDSRRGA